MMNMLLNYYFFILIHRQQITMTPLSFLIKLSKIFQSDGWYLILISFIEQDDADWSTVGVKQVA